MKEQTNTVLPQENTALSLVFSPHDKIKSFKRSAYNALDLLGDIGGLYDGLKLLLTAFLTACSGIDYTSILISKLY